MTITRAIKTFKEYYQKTVREALALITQEQLESYAEMIQKAVSNSRGILYVFGNGGNYAIARQFEMALRETFSGIKLGIIVHSGIDFHTTQSRAVQYGYAEIFVRQLTEEQADKNDLVVLLSGSGNSGNVIHALDYCKKHNIPTLAFAGFSGGMLYRACAGRPCYVTQVHDQQISEDIFQSALYLIAGMARLGAREKDKCGVFKHSYLTALQRELDAVDPEFLSRVSEAVVEAYAHERSVYVLAPEGGALSVTAEHVAHNLNWDAVYKIKKPPQRFIYSTPTNGDFSGIANDRLMPGIVQIQQLERAERGDVLLMFTYNERREVVKNIYNYAKRKGINVFLFRRFGKSSDDTSDEFTVANAFQIMGHMLGRIIHMRLKLALGEDVAQISSNQAQYLIKHYLAQRELIEEETGL